MTDNQQTQRLQAGDRVQVRRLPRRLPDRKTGIIIALTGTNDIHAWVDFDDMGKRLLLTADLERIEPDPEQEETRCD